MKLSAEEGIPVKNKLSLKAPGHGTEQSFQKASALIGHQRKKSKIFYH